ncbi:PREDICTED: uncharacterized protein LOC107072035 [Polistes dominula]|uniref:Pre-rRNA-processing protein TSR2 homolog n=1 Tax=Polistes dominula TaxID=743375 RepID=A0ABM1J3Q8_POLDO|nr:PREDICTED: uncharacterized protein LOC107072035 [Polistes dominula]
MDFYFSLTVRVFSNWTALRLAVENDMGSKDEAYEFCRHVADFLCESKNLFTSEIQDLLEDYMEDAFNTELQDFSGKQVADELYRFYSKYNMGNVSEVESELEKLPPVQPWILPNKLRLRTLMKPSVAEQPNVAEMDSDSSESDENEESMEIEKDSEWTVVSLGRRRNRL